MLIAFLLGKDRQSADRGDKWPLRYGVVDDELSAGHALRSRHNRNPSLV